MHNVNPLAAKVIECLDAVRLTGDPPVLELAMRRIETTSALIRYPKCTGTAHTRREIQRGFHLGYVGHLTDDQSAGRTD
jgi:hypothetical protein